MSLGLFHAIHSVDSQFLLAGEVILGGVDLSPHESETNTTLTHAHTHASMTKYERVAMISCSHSVPFCFTVPIITRLTCNYYAPTYNSPPIPPTPADY